MDMPIDLPVVVHSNLDGALFALPRDASGVQPQGCNVFEWAGCAAAVAGCAALSGPALIACVAAAAPGCVKCVT